MARRKFGKRFVGFAWILGAWAIVGLATAQPASDPTAAAFRLAQHQVNAAVVDQISLATLRDRLGGQASGQLIDQHLSLTEEIEALRKERLSDTEAPASADAAKRRANLFDRESRLRAELDLLSDKLSATVPEFAQLYRPQTLTIADTQALLRPAEALVLIAVGEKGVHLFAVTREAFVWNRSESNAAAILRKVQTLRVSLGADRDVRGRSLPVSGSSAGAGGFDRSTAFALYQDVFAPIAEAVAGKEIVYIARSGALRQLPMSLLVTKSPHGADADPVAVRDTTYLIDQYAIAELPSVTSLNLLRQRAASRPVWKFDFVGVGAPRLQPNLSPSSVRGLADVSALARLPELSGAAQELTEAAARNPGRATMLLMGADATETNVRGARKADIEQARIIAFSTHALQANEPGARSSGEPGLVLATPRGAVTVGDDGFLSASEIASLRLNAELVVLSACNTAGSLQETESDGPGALAQAFFAAGARGAMISHWPVDDAATSLLMQEVLAGGNAATVRGFKNAIASVRRRPNTINPRLWGAFTFVGVDR